MNAIVIVLFCAVLIGCVAAGKSVIGALLIGLALFVLYGKYRGHSWKALWEMSLSGVKTVSNILISLVFLFLYGALYLPLQSSSFGMYLLEMLQITAYLSLSFAVFNFLPIPPLDGSKVLFSVVSDETYMKLMRYERYGSIALLLLVSTGILGRPLSSAVHFLYAHMIPVAQWSLKGVYSLFYQ